MKSRVGEQAHDFFRQHAILEDAAAEADLLERALLANRQRLSIDRIGDAAVKDLRTLRLAEFLIGQQRQQWQPVTAEQAGVVDVYRQFDRATAFEVAPIAKGTPVSRLSAMSSSRRASVRSGGAGSSTNWNGPAPTSPRTRTRWSTSLQAARREATGRSSEVR